MTNQLCVVPADLAGSSCNLLHCLLDEKPEGFISYALVLWGLLSDWMRLAACNLSASPGSRLPKDSSSLALVRLLCGEKALLQRYMQVASAKEAGVLVTAHHSLCCLATVCLSDRPAFLPLFNTPAYADLLLDQVAAACQTMYKQRSAQQARGSSGNIAGRSSAAAVACSRLAGLQLSPDHLHASSTDSSADKAREQVLGLYAAGIRDWHKTSSSEASSRSKTGGGSRRTNSSSNGRGPQFTSAAATLLQAPIIQLLLQLAYTKPVAGGIEQNSSVALSAAAMQLMLEAAALLEGETANNRAFVMLRHQAARASREQPSMFISDRGQLLLDVLWLAAVDNYTYQQQQQEQRHQPQRRAPKQVDKWMEQPHPVEILFQMVHAKPGGELLAKEGECC